LDGRKSRVGLAVAIVGASLVSMLGPMIYVNEGRYSNVFFAILGVLYMPGLTFAAVAGGASGIGTVHEPSFLLASVVNCALYFLGLFLILRRISKSHA
jgi:hypothetical protein